MRNILEDIKKHPIIAAIRDIDNVDIVIDKPIKCIFLLTGNILNIKYAVQHLQRADKRVFLHVDLLEGISQDNAGIRYIAQEVKPDGIITTRGNIIGCAKKERLFTIQRVFILDSLAIDTAKRSIRKINSDAVEILPGVIPKTIKKLHKDIKHPLIAGGLIEDLHEIKASLEAGAVAVSASKQRLWNKA